MNIRTLTYFVDPAYPPDEERVVMAGRLMGEVKAAFAAGGYSVQTVRLAIPPFPVLLKNAAHQVVPFAQELETVCFVNQIDFVNIGPVRPEDPPVFFNTLPDVIGATENVFAAALIADPLRGINLPAVRQVAEIIRRCATLTPTGFSNLRFAALVNVLAGTPYFPAAYHDGGPPLLTVGVEAADLAVSAVAEAVTLADARRRLVQAVEAEAHKITQIARQFGGRLGLRFGGIDFSLAPYPEAARSLGTALERLSGGQAGEHGTLAAAAFLADALDRVQIKYAGFTGLFFPVLEDAVLAERAAAGLLTVNDLLLYCSVCGTGLDTVPLPGDISSGALAAILLDVAALALRLNKPLTARLMPIPGRRAGEEVSFDFRYFAASRVLAPRAKALGGLFGGDETFDLRPRSR